MYRFINILAMAAAATAQTAGTGQGTLIVNGNRYEPKYARAAILPDEIDKGKDMLRVMVSDAPFPGEAMLHDVDLVLHGGDGKINGVELDFHADGLIWLLRTSDTTARFSRSQNPNPFSAKIVGGNAEGARTASQKSGPNIEIAVEVSLKYSGSNRKICARAGGDCSRCGSGEAQPCPIAYLGFADAIGNGDRPRLLAMLPPDRREKIDNEHFRKSSK
jgi:hypothetical protein